MITSTTCWIWRVGRRIPDFTSFPWWITWSPIHRGKPPQASCPIRWLTLAAMALVTKRIRLLTLVTNASVRHPVAIAKTAASLDRLSKGRMTLGLGAGGYAADNHALGIDHANSQERIDRLNETVAAIRLLWSGNAVTHRGRYYSFANLISQPTPVHRPDVLVAGRQPRCPRRCRQISRLVQFYVRRSQSNCAGATTH